MMKLGAGADRVSTRVVIVLPFHMLRHVASAVERERGFCEVAMFPLRQLKPPLNAAGVLFSSG